MTDRRVGSEGLNVDITLIPERRMGSTGLNVDVIPVQPGQRQVGGVGVMVDFAPPLSGLRQVGAVSIMADSIPAPGNVVGTVGMQVEAGAPTSLRVGGVGVQADAQPTTNLRVGSVVVMVDTDTTTEEPPEPLPPDSDVRHGFYHGMEEHSGLAWDGSHHDFGAPFTDETGPDYVDVPGALGSISAMLLGRTLARWDQSTLYVVSYDDENLYRSGDQGQTWTLQGDVPGRWVPYDYQMDIDSSGALWLAAAIDQSKDGVAYTCPIISHVGGAVVSGSFLDGSQFVGRAAAPYGWYVGGILSATLSVNAPGMPGNFWVRFQFEDEFGRVLYPGLIQLSAPLPHRGSYTYTGPTYVVPDGSAWSVRTVSVWVQPSGTGLQDPSTSYTFSGYLENLTFGGPCQTITREDGIYRSTDEGVTWERLIPIENVYTTHSYPPEYDGDPVVGFLNPHTLSVGDSKVWYSAGSGGDAYEADYPDAPPSVIAISIYRANLDGTGQEMMATFYDAPSDASPFAMRASGDDLVLVMRSEPSQLTRVMANGDVFNITPPDPGYYVWDAVALNSSVYVCMMADSGGAWNFGRINVWRTTDRGKTWTQTLHVEGHEAASTLGVPADYGYFSLSRTPSRDTNEVFMSGSLGRVGKPPDALHPDYPGDPADPSTSAGLTTWYSQDGGATWEAIVDNNIPIYNDGFYYYSGPGSLHAADFLATPSVPNVRVKWPNELFTLVPSDPQVYWTQVTPTWPNPSVFSLYAGTVVEFQDTFDRPDSDTVGNGWTEAGAGGNWILSGGAVHSVDWGASYLMRPAEVQSGGDEVSADYLLRIYVSLGAEIWGSARGIGIVGRYVDESTFYLVWIDGVDGNVKVYRGGYVEIGPWVHIDPPPNPFTFTVGFRGTSIFAYLNGALLHEWIDGTHSAPGAYGMRTFNAAEFSNSFDEFFAGAYADHPPADPVIWAGDHFETE